MQWSPDAAREAANNIRLVGLMTFGGGLVERVLMQFKARESPEPPVSNV